MKIIQTTAPTRLLYSISEVAAMLNLNEKTIRRLVLRGLLKKSNAVRHIRIPKESIDAFITTTTK